MMKHSELIPLILPIEPSQLYLSTPFFKRGF